MAETVTDVRSLQTDPQSAEITLPSARSRFSADWAAVAVLVACSAILIWFRIRFHVWIERTDILQYFLPNYYRLGQQLRDFDIPGWNPYQFAGQPFAADPQSGWMQLPVMVLFALLDPVPALNGLLTFNLLLGVFATYAYARIVGLGVLASLAGAISFGYISLIQFNTHCCTLQGNLAPWIPLALIGVELAVRCNRLIYRGAAIYLTGLALSQMLAAWIGQGAYYALILVGSYVFYRTVISPVGESWTAKRRIVSLIVTGSLVLLTAFALSAAAVWPRLDVNRYTNLSGGNYEALGAGSGSGWSFTLMLDRMFDPVFAYRRVYVGTVVAVLAMLAPFLARKRCGVPFFTGLTAVGFILTLDTTPVHQLFYLLPKLQVLHEHSEYRVLGVFYIGPAMLVAATVESLWRARVRARTVALALIPVVAYAGIAVILHSRHRSLPHFAWVLAGVTIIIVAAMLLIQSNLNGRLLRSVRPFAGALSLLLIVLLLVDPAGKEMAEALRGRSSSVYLQMRFDSRGYFKTLVQHFSDCPSRNGPAGFLHDHLNTSEAPFRYFGYDPAGLRFQGASGIAYHQKLHSSVDQSLIVGNRATCVGLYDVQGYNPIQIQRYVDFLRQINGVKLNYHDAAILEAGVDSPLLQLLNPAYIIIPSVIPPPYARPDLNELVSKYPTVHDTGVVRVLENTDAMPHAWIVHDVRQMTKDEILEALDSGKVDPKQTAVVEVSPPSFDPSPSKGEDSINFTSYESNRIAMEISTSGDGMLVLSEIYLPGWNAYIDGKKAEVYATDYVLRGVPITAGARRVELRYEPATLRYGVWISAAAVIVMVSVFAAAGWTWLRKR